VTSSLPWVSVACRKRPRKVAGPAKKGIQAFFSDIRVTYGIIAILVVILLLAIVIPLTRPVAPRVAVA